MYFRSAHPTWGKPFFFFLLLFDPKYKTNILCLISSFWFTLWASVPQIVLFTSGLRPSVNSTILEAPLPIVSTRNSQGKVYLYIIFGLSHLSSCDWLKELHVITRIFNYFRMLACLTLRDVLFQEWRHFYDVIPEIVHYTWLWLTINTREGLWRHLN